MSQVVLPAKVRKETGTRKVWDIRNAGDVPGVLYGHKEAVINVAVPLDRFLMSFATAGTACSSWTWMARKNQY